MIRKSIFLLNIIFSGLILITYKSNTIFKILSGTQYEDHEKASDGPLYLMILSLSILIYYQIKLKSLDSKRKPENFKLLIITFIVSLTVILFCIIFHYFVIKDSLSFLEMYHLKVQFLGFCSLILTVTPSIFIYFHTNMRRYYLDIFTELKTEK